VSDSQEVAGDVLGEDAVAGQPDPAAPGLSACAAGGCDLLAVREASPTCLLREIIRSSVRGLERSSLNAVRGDRVEVVVDTGNGVRTYEIDATKAGRRVEVSTVRGIVEVSEVTRTGQTVRTGRFMAARVVALVEHPAEPTPERGRRRRASKDQAALL
jgi:hypothetical protein